MTTLLRLVGAGIGVAPATESMGKVGAPGVRFVPFSPPGPLLEMIVAWRKDNLSPIVPHFTAIVREAREKDPR